MGNNLIQRLDNSSFGILPNLTLLNLSSNRIENITPNAFTYLDSLTELYLSNNLLKELKLVGLNNLEILDISDNYFKQIPNELHLRKLRKLSLAGNRITTIEENDFLHLTRLEYIDLSKNLIRSISDQAFQYLNDLRVLNLATNSISKQSDLNSNLLRNQINLDILDLSDNKINYFPYPLLDNQSNLKQLFLDYNFIDELTNEMLKNLVSLEELSISYNLIDELKDGMFYYNQNLKFISLAGNKISSVNDNVFIGCSDNLLGLDISYNDLIDLPRLVMPKLIILNLSLNQFKELSKDHFINLPALMYLNISNSLSNEINILPSTIFNYNRKLEFLDLSNNQIDSIENGVFRNLSFTNINLSKNKLKELGQSTFEDLSNLKYLDLSNNQIAKIENEVFDGLPKLKTLILSKNKLSSFKSELFTTRTEVERLDLCSNEINYLYPNSLYIHRKLKFLSLCQNNLNYFPNEIVNSISTLEELDLSSNRLKSLDTENFSNLSKLKILKLNDNQLSSIGENVFHNLISLSKLDLSSNVLTDLDMNSFYNLLSLDLDLSNNQLSNLDEDLFNLEKIAILHELNLSNNNLTNFPINPLRKQSTNLLSLDISSNQISHLPANTELLVNLKKLDISSNHLSDNAIKILFTEPKSAKYLNLANVGINNFNFDTIEAPFLRSLNLSGNHIKKLNGKLFEKLSLLEVLDLSSNLLSSSLKQFSDVWSNLPSLKILNLSSNRFKKIEKDDFQSLSNLVSLDISGLKQLIDLDCRSISELNYLKELIIYNYTSLKNLELQECFTNNKKLTRLDVEIKSSELKGHLFNAYSTRLNRLIIYGRKLNKISSNFLYGIRSKQLELTFFNTSLREIPLQSLQSLSLKSEIQFNIILSNEFSFSNNSLVDLNNKQLNVKIDKLLNVTLPCDCSIETMYKLVHTKLLYNLNNQRKSIFLDSLINHFEDITCNQPTNLIGYKLNEIDFNELICLDNHDSPISSENNYTLINKESKNDATELSTSQSIENRTTSSLPTSSINYNLNHNDNKPIDRINYNQASLNHNQQDNLLTRQTIRKNKQNLKLKSNDLQLKTNQVSLSSLSFTKVDTIIIGSTVGAILFILILMIVCCFGMRMKSNLDPTYYFNYANGSNLFGQPLTINNRNQSSLESSNCTCMKASCLQLHQHQTNNSPYSSSLNNSLLNFGNSIYQQHNDQQNGNLEPMQMYYMK